MGYLPDPTYDDFGADDYFVWDQHPRGFARVLDAVAAGALDGGGGGGGGGALSDGGWGARHAHGTASLLTPCLCVLAPSLTTGRLVLGARVERIAYTCDGVRGRARTVEAGVHG